MALNGAFSHLVVECSDLDRSEAFYRDVIGLDVLGRNLVADNRPNAPTPRRADRSTMPGC
jgi:catechol 2,3-dioxygenase-like lactoylglutathione lyase family enzyme